MKTILVIAVRNLKRHKRRTLLTGIVISFGLWIFIFMDSVMSGLDRDSIDNMLNLTTSAVKIHTRKYNEEKESFPLRFGIPNKDSVILTLLELNRVNGVAPRTMFIGELSDHEETIPIIGTVVDPAAETGDPLPWLSTSMIPLMVGHKEIASRKDLRCALSMISIRGAQSCRIRWSLAALTCGLTGTKTL